MNDKKQIADLFEVVRGKKIEEVAALTNWWTMLHKDETDETKLQIAGLTRKIKEAKGSYDGVYFSNYFKVDQDIDLVDLGFLGPFSAEKALYTVRIEIFQPKPNETIPLATSTRRIVRHLDKLTLIKDEDFYVGFPSPIPIQGHKWYLIQFMLTGPDTWRCEKTFQTVKVSIGDLNVNFEFSQGSKQMHSMRFSLPPQ